jgi:flagellar motor switch protein FliN/FliY
MSNEDGLNGGMSQEDIDAALAAAGGGAPDAGGAQKTDGPDASDGLLSQADIDAALGGGGGSDAPASADLSQADIDAALAAAGGQADASGDLSQAAIDAALAGAEATIAEGSDPEPPPPDTRVDAAGNPFDEVAAAMAEAIESEQGGDGASALGDPPAGAAVEPADMPDFSAGTAAGGGESEIDLLEDVELNVKIELGRTRMLVEDVLKLGDGSVVELDKLAGDPVDVLVNDRLVARGEVLVLNDNFCVRINEIVSQSGEAIRS